QHPIPIRHQMIDSPSVFCQRSFIRYNHPMIVTICQQKGGTGKSTTALNLSACLGTGTLLVDLDPQGACAISLGINPDELDVTVYDALTERADVAQAIIPTSYGSDLLPANIDLAAAEVELTSMPGRDYALRRALKPV